MVTIKQIAEKAGVSIGTVDRVIHGRGRVAPHTEAAIRKVIDDFGYEPNLFARNLKLGRNFCFGIVMPKNNQDGGYWAQPEAGMKKALEELKMQRVSAEFFFYDKYAAKPLSGIKETILDDGLSGLLIAPILTEPLTGLVSQLPQTMPYVFFDSDLPGLNPLSVINQDAFQSGRLAAELMLKLIHKTGPIVVVKIVPDDYHLKARVRGFLEYLQPEETHPVFIHEADVGCDPGCIRSLVVAIHNQYPELQGLFVSNALTYRVAEVLPSLSFENKPVLVGYDLIDSNAEWLEKGVIDFIISQRPEMQGYQGIYSLYRHAILKEAIERRMTMPLDIITKENMRYHQTNKS